MACSQCKTQPVAFRKYCKSCEAEFVFITFTPTTPAREIAPQDAPADVKLAVTQRNAQRVVLSQQLSTNVMREAIQESVEAIAKSLREEQLKAQRQAQDTAMVAVPDSAAEIRGAGVTSKIWRTGILPAC